MSKKRAETNSFSQESFRKDQLEDKRAKTNGFSTHSFPQRILSLQMCFLIFLFGSFYLAGAALYLTTCSFKISLPTESLQQEELAAAYCNKSFQQESLQQDELQTAYLHQLDRDTSLSFHCFSLPRCSKNQLDPVQSLSFQMLGSTSVSYQLQADSFHRISFELRASICAALFQTIRIRNRQLQSFQLSDQQSFQLTGFQLSNALASGGVQQTASQNQLPALTLTALSRRTLSAWILHSLSLALCACQEASSHSAWRSLSLGKSLLTTSLSTTTSSHRSASMIAFAATSLRRAASASALRTTSFRTTSSFRTTLSCFSFLVHNFSFNQELGILSAWLSSRQPWTRTTLQNSASA